MAPDGRFMRVAGNAGSDADDIDRRHIVKVPVDKAEPTVVTPGKGVEWPHFMTGDGGPIAFFTATSQRPPAPAVVSANGGTATTMAEERLPSDYPTSHLVTP